VDQVRAAGQVAHEAAAVGEVGGGHLGDRGLVAGPEGPEDLLGGLAVQAPHVLGLAHGVALAGLAGVVRERRDVAVAGDGGAGPAQDRVAEHEEHPEGQDDHALVGRQGRAVREVGPAQVLRRAAVGEQVVAAGQGAGGEARGPDEAVTLGLLHALFDVRQFGHVLLFFLFDPRSAC